DICKSYDSAVWTAANIDDFVKNYLGPTFVGLSTRIFVPETSTYDHISSRGNTCATDSSCKNYIGGVNWHDYDASLSGTHTVAADKYPAEWAPRADKRYWETEASCCKGSPATCGDVGFGPEFCGNGFNKDMTDALRWAAVIDQRIA